MKLYRHMALSWNSFFLPCGLLSFRCWEWIAGKGGPLVTHSLWSLWFTFRSLISRVI